MRGSHATQVAGAITQTTSDNLGQPFVDNALDPLLERLHGPRLRRLE